MDLEEVFGAKEILRQEGGGGESKFLRGGGVASAN